MAGKMNVIGIFGVLLGVVFLVYATAVKNWMAMPATLAASLIIIICNKMPVWESISTVYSSSLADYVKNFLILLVTGAFFGELMAVSGCADTLANYIIEIAGMKNIGIAIYLLTCILTYGGVNQLIAIYCIYPIGSRVLKAANFPPKYFLILFLSGSCTITMTSVPGSPATQNIIAAQYLGTSLMASPRLCLAGTVIIASLSLCYFRYEERRFRADGNDYTAVVSFQVPDDGKERRRGILSAILPLLTLVILVIVLNRFFNRDSVEAVVYATIAASVSCFLLNYYRFKTVELSKILTKGFQSGMNSTLSLAAMLGFGGIVSATPVFNVFMNAIYGLPFNPVVLVMITVNLLCGIMGTSSGGLTVFMNYLADKYINLGISPEILHRIAVMSCGGLDTLPHSGALFIFLNTCGLTHKETYKEVFITTVVIPVIALVPIAILASSGVT